MGYAIIYPVYFPTVSKKRYDQIFNFREQTHYWRFELMIDGIS